MREIPEDAILRDDGTYWVDCWSCFGEGAHEDCYEDTCVCIEPPCLWTRCDVREGKGGWELDEDSADD